MSGDVCAVMKPGLNLGIYGSVTAARHEYSYCDGFVIERENRADLTLSMAREYCGHSLPVSPPKMSAWLRATSCKYLASSSGEGSHGRTAGRSVLSAIEKVSLTYDNRLTLLWLRGIGRVRAALRGRSIISATFIKSSANQVLENVLTGRPGLVRATQVSLSKAR
jgi:hypothetical protein